MSESKYNEYGGYVGSSETTPDGGKIHYNEYGGYVGTSSPAPGGGMLHYDEYGGFTGSSGPGLGTRGPVWARTMSWSSMLWLLALPLVAAAVLLLRPIGEARADWAAGDARAFVNHLGVTAVLTCALVAPPLALLLQLFLDRNRSYPPGKRHLLGILALLSVVGAYFTMFIAAPAVWALGAFAVRTIDRSPKAYTNRGAANFARILGMVWTLLVLAFLVAAPVASKIIG